MLRQAEVRNGTSCSHKLAVKQLTHVWLRADLDQFQHGLEKVRKAREMFPSAAWTKQLEGEFLYHIGMRLTNVRSAFPRSPWLSF